MKFCKILPGGCPRTPRIVLPSALPLMLICDVTRLWQNFAPPSEIFCVRHWTHSCFFSQSINVRGLPLSVFHCLAALPAKMCAFNNLKQQNACHRNITWTFVGLLPWYCYAVKTNSRTINWRLPQHASAGKGADMSVLQAHHCMTLTVNLTFVQCEFHTGKETVIARTKSINRN